MRRMCGHPAALARNDTSVTGWNDRGRLDHEDHRALGRSRAMHHTLRHDEPLARQQFDYPPWGLAVGALLEVDEEPPLDDVEELVIVVVLMPVIFALHD